MFVLHYRKAMEKHFVYINPEHNNYRFYSLSIAPNLFNNYYVIRVWGRIGRKGRIRTIYCDTLSDATREFNRQVAKRIKRGYEEVHNRC